MGLAWGRKKENFPWASNFSDPHAAAAEWQQAEASVSRAPWPHAEQQLALANVPAPPVLAAEQQLALANVPAPPVPAAEQQWGFVFPSAVSGLAVVRGRDSVHGAIFEMKVLESRTKLHDFLEMTILSSQKSH